MECDKDFVLQLSCLLLDAQFPLQVVGDVLRPKQQIEERQSCPYYQQILKHVVFIKVAVKLQKLYLDSEQIKNSSLICILAEGIRAE